MFGTFRLRRFFQVFTQNLHARLRVAVKRSAVVVVVLSLVVAVTFSRIELNGKLC